MEMKSKGMPLHTRMAIGFGVGLLFGMIAHWTAAIDEIP